ncbi:hypothetical protein [Bifidobacterium castoris]|uniref:Uncharacterized protein n=1 Tax=Bifidobacterium castoris TaxID=2306972 RepID=A0A430F5B0_9BIFI|nr:hypothetical protein [Bifidobacterium castoris]RSX46128.1 hypothetical protein D2E22_1700 [Bifidobacterium castoris]
MTANNANAIGEVDANAVVDALCRQIADLTRQNAVLMAANAALLARANHMEEAGHE